MRIAQVAPLYESVPPRGYGGTERVVSWLTEQLVRDGHDVTLFASGDSATGARLIAECPKSLRRSCACLDFLPHHMVMLQQVFKHASEFDIIHFHTDYLHFSLARHLKVPHVTTLHGRLDTAHLVPLYREFKDVPVVSISRSQRQPLPWINWIGNVYHGLPQDLLSFQSNPGKYLAFVGRISPEKRPDRVIEIATLAGMPVKIAAKVDRVDREYFETTIRPLLSRPGLEFIGEIGDEQKGEFLGNAFANLFPIDWPEPFGLSMIEAMACGTPTIAFRNGSVPEIIDEGVTGFIVESVEDAVKAIERVQMLQRDACRRTFEKRFTGGRMASEYVETYQFLIDQHKRYPTEPEVRESTEARESNLAEVQLTP
jgi:glycosyltransferase involved in cell wall biosynthesis